MLIRTAEFELSASGIAGCPPEGVAEFPLIGRSNVGKSSLLNMLTNRKALARVSSKPGHTQTINFFAINGTWRLVDLPGYGYVKRGVALREQFAELLTGYLTGRESIRCVFVLIDSRIEPKQIDLDFVSWLCECRVPHAIVFTKTDKMKPAVLKKNTEDWIAAQREFTGHTPHVLYTSAETTAGKKELLKFIESRM